MSGITQIPGQLEQGDAKVVEKLLPLLDDELRRLAANTMAEEALARPCIAMPSAKQWWAYARAWLTVELRAGAR